ncbi:MAG: phosphatidylglycerophosphatase A [Anaplasmataceae bacterium]|nr:phosphatidylglycerophosphatase A [Anaplasmataceae bacterium]
MKKLSKNIYYDLILTCGFMGFSPFAPGTVCSFFVTIISFYLLNVSHILLGILILISTATGVYLSTKVVKETKKIDPKEIVIDELVGQGLALLISDIYVMRYTYNHINIYHAMLLFILFRVFDILKPMPIDYIDDNFHYGFGVMFDDVIAGIFASIYFIFILSFL